MIYDMIMKKKSTYHDILLRIKQKAHYGILISIVVLDVSSYGPDNFPKDFCSV